MNTKKTAIIIILIALVGIVAWVLLSGGGGKTISPDEKQEGPKTESLLTDILGKAGNISSFKYDMVVTAPGQSATIMKMWRQGKKMKMEGTFEGKSMAYFINMDEQSAYMYLPAENTAMKMDMTGVQGIMGSSPTEQSGSIMQHNPIVLGSEVLDGKNCKVVEYVTEGGKVKMWIWEKYGFPIKTETTTAQSTSVVELKNIDFSNIPDSVFELPTGVEIMEMPVGF